MTYALIIIILLAVLAFTFASYSRMGDILNTLEQQGDSLTGTLYKLTEIRNNASDAGKKSAEALGDIHESLKGIRENSGFVRDSTIFLSDISYELVGVAKDINYIKSLYEDAANEAERVRAEEGKEPEPDPQPEPEQENEPETETETEPEQKNQ